MPQKQVAVAMSGGVDSSLATALLKEAGYRVIGITMQIWPSDQPARFGGCCGIEAIADAKKVAYRLGIPHYVVNFRDIFAREVIADFCREYSLGRTPNPCIRCNQYIKFDALLKKVEELGSSFIATGHYARIEQSADGYRLLKATDPAKDQSYFLYTLGQNQLQRLLLPVGHLHKTEVRRLSAEIGLPTAAKSESQDICFIPGNDYREFIARRISVESGEIVDTRGKVLGQHGGLARYTVGQRQGLGLTSTERLYVLRLDAADNRLVVGTPDQLFSNRLFAGKLSWVSGQAPEEPINITAKIRYRSPEAAAELQLNDGVAEVSFQQPQRAITPGQAIVFYQGDTVLGGGIIEDRVD